MRVYAPDLRDQAPLLIIRHRQILDDIAVELERRFDIAGNRALYSYLDELDRAVQGLESFREELATFIRNSFPPDNAARARHE